jgi:hypothetical protein
MRHFSEQSIALEWWVWFALAAALAGLSVQLMSTSPSSFASSGGPGSARLLQEMGQNAGY